MPTALDDQWASSLSEIIGGGTKVNLVGIGNPIKGDDSVGLAVVSELLRLLGPSPTSRLAIHEPSMSPERTLSRLALKGERIVIFDAVETGKEPGAILCAKLSDTKFGFFATHNIPLRIVPGLGGMASDVYLLGIQPESVEVGKGLTKSVETASRRVVAAIVGIAGRTG